MNGKMTILACITGFLDLQLFDPFYEKEIHQVTGMTPGKPLSLQGALHLFHTFVR